MLQVNSLYDHNNLKLALLVFLFVILPPKHMLKKRLYYELLARKIAEMLSLNHGTMSLEDECVMDKIERCESCGEKPAEYVLDDRHLCVECYKREEKRQV
jgi:hypothetical protein